MLIDYKILVEKYDWKPKGVIHIGGHRGEEQSVYDAMGVANTLWIEAIQESADWIRDRFADRDDINVICATLSDKTEAATLHITNNLASSSILPLGTHSQSHPDIHVTEKRKVRTALLSILLIWQEDIMYDCINIDIQGAELKALKGAYHILDGIDTIYTEVNTEEVYKGCALLPAMDEYLAGFGFTRVEIKMTRHGWGDAFYIKK